MVNASVALTDLPMGQNYTKSCLRSKQTLMVLQRLGHVNSYMLQKRKVLQDCDTLCWLVFQQVCIEWHMFHRSHNLLDAHFS